MAVGPTQASWLAALCLLGILSRGETGENSGKQFRRPALSRSRFNDFRKIAQDFRRHVYYDASLNAPYFQICAMYRWTNITQSKVQKKFFKKEYHCTSRDYLPDFKGYVNRNFSPELFHALTKQFQSRALGMSEERERRQILNRVRKFIDLKLSNNQIEAYVQPNRPALSLQDPNVYKVDVEASDPEWDRQLYHKLQQSTYYCKDVRKRISTWKERYLSFTFKPTNSTVEVSSVSEIGKWYQMLDHVLCKLDGRFQLAGSIILKWASRQVMASQIKPRAWTILLAKYFQSIEPSIFGIFPEMSEESMQSIEGNAIMMQQSFEKHITSFLNAQKAAKLKRMNNTSVSQLSNPASVPELLFGFFYFYGYLHSWNTEIINLRQSSYDMQSPSSRFYPSSSPMVVLDPWDNTTNLINLERSEARQLIYEFRTAVDGFLFPNNNPLPLVAPPSSRDLKVRRESRESRSRTPRRSSPDYHTHAKPSSPPPPPHSYRSKSPPGWAEGVRRTTTTNIAPEAEEVQRLNSRHIAESTGVRRTRDPFTQEGRSSTHPLAPQVADSSAIPKAPISPKHTPTQTRATPPPTRATPPPTRATPPPTRATPPPTRVTPPPTRATPPPTRATPPPTRATPPPTRATPPPTTRATPPPTTRVTPPSPPPTRATPPPTRAAPPPRARATPPPTLPPARATPPPTRVSPPPTRVSPPPTRVITSKNENSVVRTGVKTSLDDGIEPQNTVEKDEKKRNLARKGNGNGSNGFVSSNGSDRAVLAKELRALGVQTLIGAVDFIGRTFMFLSASTLGAMGIYEAAKVTANALLDLTLAD